MTSVLSWRIARAADGRGLLCWFDPLLEDVEIRHLTAPERADRLTSMGSVSALVEGDGQLDLEYDSTHTELNDAS